MLDLFESGVPFDGSDGKPDLGLEAGHSSRRILHAGGGATGEMVSEALLARVLRNRNVQILTNTPVDRLVVQRPRGRRDERRHLTRARAVRAGHRRLRRPVGALDKPAREPRASALALAWQAGASLADLEFVQFHPTALDVPGAPAYLLSEALRGEGALLVDGDGQAGGGPAAAPRRRGSRHRPPYRRSTAPVYLSLRHLDPIA